MACRKSDYSKRVEGGMKTMWELFLVTHLKEETHKEVLILQHLRVDWSCVKLVTWVV